MATKPRTELTVILLLGAVLLATSLPFYQALSRSPEEVFFGEGVFLLSQASKGFPLTEELVDSLRDQPWAKAVSPEAYAFIALQGRGVIVRGVEADPFLRIEGTAVPEPLGSEFLLVGQRLADELGVREGDPLWLPGSLRPALVEATVDAILPSPGAVADELLLDLPRGRALTGLLPGSYHLLRVQTSEGERLLDFLASQRATILVGDGETNLEVADGQIHDDRLSALLLSAPELAGSLGRSVISSFAKYSGNSLQLVVLGMEVLTFLLFFLLLATAVGRFLLEHRRQMGILTALGGTASTLLRSYGTSILLLGVLAGMVGGLLGVGIGLLLQQAVPFRFLGHALAYGLDPSLLLRIAAVYGGALLVSVLGGIALLAAQRPRDLLQEVPEGEGEEWGVPE